MTFIAILCSCSQEDDLPTPITTPSTTQTITTTSCMESTWKYEVILTTPDTNNRFTITYRDEYNNMITDNSLRTTWAKTFTQQIPFNQVTDVNTSIQVTINHLVLPAVPLHNYVKVVIYKNGNVVETTGNPIEFCYDLGTPCNGATVASVHKYYLCNAI